MKKTLKYALAVGLLIAAILCLTACGNWDPPYVDLDKDGFNVSVRFDVGDGLFAGIDDVFIIDVFKLDEQPTADGMKQLHLLAPDDSRRGVSALKPERTGYFLAGWYTERAPRTDESGNPLDDYGVPTAESGRPQGYTYSGRWDFEADTLPVDPNGTYSSENPVCTLYAAWIPYFCYEIYAPGANDEFELVTTSHSINLELPEWNEETGKLDMGNFPKRDGYTLKFASLSSGLLTPMGKPIHGAEEFVDYETGTTSVASVPVYTLWDEGEWFRIYNAEQFYSNARLDGNYILCADLDFTDFVWPPALTKGRFTGTIVGDGHTVSNIDVVQSDNSQLTGGLFGALDAGASIENVRFDNIRYTVSAGSRMQGATFGLLAGSIAGDVELQGVTLSGSLLISENCYPQDNYLIGLLTGSGTADIDISSITCAVAEEGSTMLSVEADDAGAVTLTFAQ